VDSVTQAALGASIAGAIAPAGQRRKALLVGAVLGTMPDLDVFIDYGDAVRNFTYHRGFSHSLIVLAPFSCLLWLALRQWWAPARKEPRRWLAIIVLALMTHPLLDAHTAYGTQLLWPLTTPPVMWGTLFIIDPLYTLPLLIGVIVSAFWPLREWSGVTLRGALAVSTLYIAWSWMAQGIVRQHTEEALAAMDIQDAPVFLTPTPFNTLLWRIVVQTREGHLEGFDSLLVDEGILNFDAWESDKEALRDASNVWAVARLRWFAQDFVKAEVRNNRLIVSDLRMGLEPAYVFTHVVAYRGNPHWLEVPTVLLPFSNSDRGLSDVWRRIFSE
jgi:inner membrane protein